MSYQLRTGDVILCENKPLDQTNAYLIVYDTDNGFGLWCLGCGEALGFYGDDIEKMKTDILNKDFLNIQKELATYEGKIDIDTNNGGYVKFDFNGKRYIYYNCFVESIADIN